jgi:hypothetical protein
MTLEIRPMMNTTAEEIFQFKSCCNIQTFDQNLEIHISNRGDRSIAVHSYFDLKSDTTSRRFENLMPNGIRHIQPGETIAFYCFMEEKTWDVAKQIFFYDTQGKSYSVNIL